MVEGWRLSSPFSAVVTTFIAQTSQSHQVDYGQVTAAHLFELIDVQRTAANVSLANEVLRSGLTPFSDLRPRHPIPSSMDCGSLVFHSYMAVPSGTPRDRRRVRQFRFVGLQQRRVGFTIGLLPVVMSMSLCIFLGGLVVFPFPLQASIASVARSITSISFASYSITSFLPLIYPSSPYKTSLSQYIFPLYTHIAFFTTVIPPMCRYRDESSPVPEKTRIRALREAVEHSAYEMEANALSC
ncbi:uncharacterized protein ARMOST_16392 [Armillaria ostoyae]|uniref:DUF6535 domain-containing protein n=1 Tax=Armillaria ostoyae TaxID=47428 RepID=A0A284RW21_ARMOS|nr:uncharacterized protein ARMOST_16392 [Armillaria ostoyae]